MKLPKLHSIASEKRPISCPFQVEEIEQELSVRFFAEELWTGVKTGYDQLESHLSEESWTRMHLTSNPHRVGILLSRLKELKLQAQELSKNSAFRPSPSQVSVVCQVHCREYPSRMSDSPTSLICG